MKKQHKYKTICKNCNSEVQYTYNDVSFGFLHPESIKCPYCGSFIDLEFK